MFKLTHISDIHLAPLPAISMGDLFSKRLTGYLNWKRGRAKNLRSDILPKLVNHLKQTNSNHIAVTGDLVNLALDQEMRNAAEFLESLGNCDDVTVVCGNHDAYVKGALKQAYDLWQDYLKGDDGEAVVNDYSFPTLRVRSNVAIIGCNSARATRPFQATGFFESDQAERLGQILKKQEQAGNCRVVLIHHPPFENATAHHKRLIGDDLFRDVIKEYGAELVLHGHTHLDTIKWIKGASKDVPVVCVPAAGQAPGGKRPAACYNLFEISATSSNWEINLQQIGYDNHSLPIDNGSDAAVKIKLLREIKLAP